LTLHLKFQRAKIMLDLSKPGSIRDNSLFLIFFP